MGGMDFDSTHEQDEAARFFLPDIDPEDAVGWPEHLTGESMFSAFDEDEEREYDPGVYESGLTDMLDIQDSLLADYVPTHETYTEWEE